MSDLTDEERQRLLDQFEKSHSPKLEAKMNADKKMQQLGRLDNIVGTEAAGRGFASGALMGYQPQIWGTIKGALTPGSTIGSEIERQRQLNENAWKNDPLSYGAGYAGGTGATLPLGVGLLRGASAAAGALGAGGISSGAARTAQALQNLSVIRPGTRLPPPAPTAQALTSVSGAMENQAPNNLQNSQEKIITTPWDRNDLQKPMTTFDKLRQMLSQTDDPAEKRKMAMDLTSSPATRMMLDDGEKNA